MYSLLLENTQVLIFCCITFIIIVVLSVVRLTDRFFDPKWLGKKQESFNFTENLTQKSMLPVHVLYVPPEENSRVNSTISLAENCRSRPFKRAPLGCYVHGNESRSFVSPIPVQDSVYNSVAVSPVTGSLYKSLISPAVDSVYRSLISPKQESVYLSPVQPVRVHRATSCPTPPKDQPNPPKVRVRANSEKRRKEPEIAKGKSKTKVKPRDEDTVDLNDVSECSRSCLDSASFGDRNSLTERRERKRRVEKSHSQVQKKPDSKSTTSFKDKVEPKQPTNASRSFCIARPALPTTMTPNGVQVDTFQRVDVCYKNKGPVYHLPKVAAEDRVTGTSRSVSSLCGSKTVQFDKANEKVVKPILVNKPKGSGSRTLNRRVESDTSFSETSASRRTGDSSADDSSIKSILVNKANEVLKFMKGDRSVSETSVSKRSGDSTPDDTSIKSILVNKPNKKLKPGKGDVPMTRSTTKVKDQPEQSMLKSMVDPNEGKSKLANKKVKAKRRSSVTGSETSKGSTRKSLRVKHEGKGKPGISLALSARKEGTTERPVRRSTSSLSRERNARRTSKVRRN